MENNEKRPPMKKFDIKTIKRIFSYMKQKHKWTLALVLFCIIANTAANIASSLFLETLVDNYITPLIGVENPVYTELIKAVGIMASFYLIGVVTIFIYTRVMVNISQSTLKTIRDEMFSKMQRLPIKYFDTHTHGDIMSHYTNDTDTLEQMIAQSLPQLIASAITIIGVFIAMLVTNIFLTLVVIVSLFIMLSITKQVAGKSGKYFIKQQQAIGKVNGYIEEMINGQKVVKVFCHEDKAKEEFDKINGELFESMNQAHKFANILMPILVALGNVQYALVAIVGGILAINGIGNITTGLIIAFLQLSKTFTRPIGQISQQLNSVVMALAGAKRIFELMDEEPEQDNGYVTLVNAKYENGVLTETKERTGIWAWKHPHHDGTLEYKEVKGNIELFDVDFAYEEGKTVLHDISIYAKPGQKIAFVGATGARKNYYNKSIKSFL